MSTGTALHNRASNSAGTTETTLHNRASNSAGTTETTLHNRASNSAGTTETTLRDLPSSALGTVEAMRALKTQRRTLDVQEMVLAAHFADLNAVVDEPAHTLPGQETLRRFGGDGTPEVAEFCVVELSAALGIRDVAAAMMIGHALDLRHRLPNLWQLMLDLEVPVWQTREIAGATRDVDAHSAGLIDLQLARTIRGMPHRAVKQLVAGLVLAHLPVEQAEQRRQTALDKRRVIIDQAPDGIAYLDATLDAPDALRLEATVTQIAGILAGMGVGGGQDARRARALGILATPARALQLQQAALQDELPQLLEHLSGRGTRSVASTGSADGPRAADPRHDPRACRGDEAATNPVAGPDLLGCPMEGQPGHACGQITVEPAKLLPATDLVIHLTDTTLADGVGPARSPQLEPLLAEWLAHLLPEHQIRVRPVIDMNHQAPSDSYECPPTMREAIEYRNPTEVFPWSTRRSKGLDLDHTIPWTPRQARGTEVGARGTGVGARGTGITHPDNLGPLSRRAHRAKTHGGWRLEQPIPGHFLWQSPLGYRYLVTPSRTIDLGRSDAPRHARSDTQQPSEPVGTRMAP